VKTGDHVMATWPWTPRTVRLPDGQEAWASTGLSTALPFIQPRSGAVNTFAWVAGDYVVSLWSDLSEARLRQLAATTAVVPPNSMPSQRGIPSTWPTPLPLERLPTLFLPGGNYGPRSMNGMAAVAPVYGLDCGL
jgi:hypothetical protein